jgi:F-type H+-transporting ATPase subunit epsilon
MASDKVLLLRVVTPARTVFEGEARSVVLPAWDGEVGILPGHAPFITLLGGGEARVELPDERTQTFFLFRGVAKVEDDRVTVLSEYAGGEPPEWFDPGMAWLDPDELEGGGSRLG